MRVLAIHSNLGKDQNKWSGVDSWRVKRPLDELKKHVSWQIDEQVTTIPEIAKYKDAKEFTPKEMQKAFDNISKYDIVFSSYHADPTGYTMYKVARDRAGTQFIMDCDDDMFAVNPDNPFWVKMTDEKCYWMQRMIADNDWISTTTEALANEFRKRRPDKDPSTVFVRPNYITDQYQHPPFDNGDKVVIGYFGGASHYGDLNETHVAEALEKLMHENKNIHFKAVGMPMDKYIPRGRYQFVDGKKGDAWRDELYPTLQMDIAIAPLHENIFNNGKSNIKFQEATRAGAAFCGSRVGPYKTLRPQVARLVNNTMDDWYRSLKALVDNVEYRKGLVTTAQAELQAEWRLEDHWHVLKEMFEKVHKEGVKNANN